MGVHGAQPCRQVYCMRHDSVPCSTVGDREETVQTKEPGRTRAGTLTHTTEHGREGRRSQVKAATLGTVHSQKRAAPKSNVTRLKTHLKEKFLDTSTKHHKT